MRTTDDPTPEKFPPFGPAVPREAPKPTPAPAPRGSYGVVTDPDGKLRTTKSPNP